MLALIDADIVAYRCAASATKDEEWVAIARTNELVEQILHDVNATEYKLFLSGENNFRRLIYPEYKANRVQPKPKHLVACKEFLVKQWDALTTDGYEADDALGMEQVAGLYKFDPDPDYWNQPKFNKVSIVCSIDKDLKMIPGYHYNFVKKEFDFITVEKGMRTFYTSMLVGDPADNIKGVPGIGKAKAPKILDGCQTEAEMCEVVRQKYNNDHEFVLNADLLWIWRGPNDRWSLNRGKKLLPELEVPREYTQSMEVELTECMELGITK